MFLNRVPTPRASASHVMLHVSPTPVPSPAGDSVWAVDVPTWITAIATAGLLAGAIITAICAAKAFRNAHTSACE